MEITKQKRFSNWQKAMCFICFLSFLTGCALWYPPEQEEKETFITPMPKHKQFDTLHLGIGFEAAHKALLDTMYLSPDIEQVWGGDSVRAFLGKKISPPLELKATHYHNGVKYGEFVRMIDADYPIYYWHYGAREFDKPIEVFKPDCIVIGNKRFVFTEFLGQNPPWDEGNEFTLYDIRLFWLNGHRYLTLVEADAPCIGSAGSYRVELFDVTNKHDPHLVVVGRRAACDGYGWGDYNGDGKLDLVYRARAGFDSLLCKTLENGKLVPLKGYQIVFDNPYQDAKVDLLKSRWFFPLK